MLTKYCDEPFHGASPAAGSGTVRGAHISGSASFLGFGGFSNVLRGVVSETSGKGLWKVGVWQASVPALSVLLWAPRY